MHHFLVRYKDSPTLAPRRVSVDENGHVTLFHAPHIKFRMDDCERMIVICELAGPPTSNTH